MAGEGPPRRTAPHSRCRSSACGLLLLALVSPSFGAPPWTGFGPHDERHFSQQAGVWRATVEKTLVGSPQRHVLTWNQKVFRQGPDDSEPVLVYEQTFSDGVRIHLREDGLLLVEPAGSALPRLYFPRSKDPVEIRLPPPRTTDPDDYDFKMGTTWFLDDSLFYSRHYLDHRLIGYLRIDPKKSTLNESKLCLDIVADEDSGRPLPAVFRAGDYIFWVNKGYDNTIIPPEPSNEWVASKMRALSMTSCKAIEPEDVPLEVIQRNKTRLLKFVEDQVHNRSPLFEVWAVGILARVGDANDAERLRALSRTAKETTTDDALVKAAYANALQTLEHRGDRGRRSE